MIESNFQEGDRMTRDISASSKKEEECFEQNLRPQTLNDFIGQKDLKEGLHIFLHAAKQRGEPVEHTLLYGNPGLGKTTLAHIIAKEMDGHLRITSGPALERVGDLAAILSNLQKGDILFIDEIHRMNRAIEEVLYPAMEDFALDLVVGKGPSARTLRLGLEKFTIIGATTRPSLLSSPLRDRFGTTYRLNFYSNEEMKQIVQRSANILGVRADHPTCKAIAHRSRKTPRIANRLLKRVRDYAEVKHQGSLNSQIAQDALTMLSIDELGLDAADRRILETIITTFKGGPVGLTTLAAATQEEASSLEEIYEPFLLQLGLIERTPRGRTVTEKGYQHIGITP